MNNNDLDNILNSFVDCLQESGITPDSIRNYKSASSKFLHSNYVNSGSLSEITASIVESYFFQYIDSSTTKSYSTYITQSNYIKKFLESFEETKTIAVNWEKIDLVAREKLPDDTNPVTRLSPKQISLIRQKYKNDVRKRYIFEMLLSGVSKKRLQVLKYDDIDFDNLIIDTSRKEAPGNHIRKKDQSHPVYLTHNLCDIINAANQQGLLIGALNINEDIEQMDEGLNDAAFEAVNFKAKDVIETSKNVLWPCPQCGRRYESTIEHWCAKQYVESESYWIVCRKCGNG